MTGTYRTEILGPSMAKILLNCTILYHFLKTFLGSMPPDPPGLRVPGGARRYADPKPRIMSKLRPDAFQVLPTPMQGSILRGLLQCLFLVIITKKTVCFFCRKSVFF